MDSRATFASTLINTESYIQPQKCFSYKVTVVRACFPTKIACELKCNFHNLDYFWSSSSTREERVQPAVDLLISLQVGTKTSSGNHKLHVHAFSNGGSLQMMQIARMLRQRNDQGSANFSGLPASSIVIDSAPGGNALAPLLTAFTMPYRSQIVRTLLYIPISLAWALLALSSLVLRRPSPIDVLRQDMLDPTLLPQGKEVVPN